MALQMLLAALPYLSRIPGAVKDLAGAFGMDRTAGAADVVANVADAIAGGRATPEQLQAADEIMLRHKEEMERIALEETRAYLGDRRDAREMQKAALGHDDWFARNFINLYAGAVSVASFVYFFMVTFMDIPDGNIRFADVILGFMLGTLIGSIVNFFFGSSKGSSEKTKLLAGGGLFDRIKRRLP